MNQFKPCPECGSHAVEISEGDDGYYEERYYVGYSLIYKCKLCGCEWTEKSA